MTDDAYQRSALTNTLNRGYDPYNHVGVQVQRSVSARQERIREFFKGLETPEGRRLQFILLFSHAHRNEP